MKTRTSPIWIPGLVLLMAWVPGGLAQNEIDRSFPFPWEAIPLSTPEPIAPATTVPPKIHLSPWTTEIVKLAHAGIEETVMLSFIDNSGMFNLGADQIIYLSDLGVPGEVISEMLRHDAEVIAGVRQLTISSEPPRDPSLQITFTTGSSASVSTSAQSATTSAPPAVVNGQLAVAPNQEPSPEAGHGVINSGASVLELAMHEPEELRWQKQPEGKKSLYPVREPYPVPLTAPIVFVQAAERIPNTIVIEWFPEPTDEH